jgi:hypothetical protein
LAERSLIQRLPDAEGGSRYQVHELIRSYALRQLEDDGQVRARHFRYFLDLVEGLETSWDTQIEPLWSNPTTADVANANAAMMWVLDQGDAEGALRMAVGLDRFWPFSVVPPALRLARLDAALDLPWSPSCHQHSRPSTGVLGLRRIEVSSRPSCRPRFAEAGTSPISKDWRPGRRSTLPFDSWRHQPSYWRS